MVTRIGFLLIAIALFVSACGGGDDSAGTSATREPAINPPAATNIPSGPNVVVEPSSGPPGIEVTVRGSGWEPGTLIDLTGELAPGTTAEPYETVVSGQDGSFSARFRLETAPDGAELSTGRYNLIARSSNTQVTIPFLVETRRPITGGGAGG